MKSNYDVLVIDDEQVIIDSVRKIAGSENYTVDSATNASAALEKIENTKYSLIISDIMMPEIDGFDFLEILNRKKIDTPVIMTTGYTTVENAVNSLSKGALGFLPKPFTIDELLSVIFRGLRFSEIKRKMENENDSSLEFVPCPSKFRRLGYSSWMNVENDGTVLYGATHLYFKTIEQITKINFYELDEKLTQGNIGIKFETSDGLTHHLLSPVSGRIIEINNEIIGNINILEKDPYFKGWLYRIIPTDLEYDMKNLIQCGSNNL